MPSPLWRDKALIKIGCCAYSYRDLLVKGNMSLEDFVEEAYKNRLDGVELTSYYFKSTEKRYLYSLKRLCLEKGLSISMVSCGAHLWSPEREEREKNLEKIKRWINITYELGAPCLRVFGGRWPPPQENLEKKPSIEDAINEAIEIGEKSAEYTTDRGVVIALENHGGITISADDVIKIIKGVDSPWFRLNLDTGNYKEDIYCEIEKSTPYAVHVHAKVSLKRRGEVLKLNYERIRKILMNAGYNGWISIEYEEAENPKTGIPRFISYLKNIFME
ncbi:TPA: sugar phosphate isomerase/epimerase [Candidatus Bathyarchaeota archaeon]|nr:sugar phosphate isomerase/epimerase [Candidatus Bathyarchaeota archaeon]